MPIEHVQRAVVVCHHHHGGTAFMGDLAEQLHDLAASLAVQCRRRLICQNKAGLVGEGAGHGHALLLTSGKGVGEIVGAIRDAQVVEQFHRPGARRPRQHVVDFQRHLDVFDSAQERDQV